MRRSRGSYRPPARLYVVGQAAGLTVDDELYVAAHPYAKDFWRPYIDGEAGGDLVGATDTFVLEFLWFDGTRSGQWQRTFVHRVEPAWAASEKGER